jgi:protein-S-isoprenylcysteine O-methyltransferase Ste14
MKLKGFNEFRKKLPWLSGKKIYLLPVFFICTIAVSILITILFDSIPDWLLVYGWDNEALSLCPLIGELLIIAAGFSLVYQLWSRRDLLKTKYDMLSYQHIFFTGFAGILFVLSVPFSLFIPFWSFSPSFWAGSTLQALAQPLESFIPIISHIIFWIRMPLAIIFLVTGIGMAVRSLQSFGLDYMALVYLYYPEEGQLQEHAIYSVLRHPAYSGVLTAAFGGMLFTFTPYSIIFFIAFITAFYMHIYLVEEKELVSRFGESFKEYRKQVPAFMVKPAKIKTLFVFLFKGPESKPNPV